MAHDMLVDEEGRSEEHLDNEDSVQEDYRQVDDSDCNS